MPEYGVCGHSDLNMGGCLRQATWLQAFQRCEQYGARLCERHELMAARYTGCSLEDVLVWTWEECAHGSPGEQHVATLGNNHRIYSCVDATELHGVRCCADDARTGFASSRALAKSK